VFSFEGKKPGGYITPKTLEKYPNATLTSNNPDGLPMINKQNVETGIIYIDENGAINYGMYDSSRQTVGNIKFEGETAVKDVAMFVKDRLGAAVKPGNIRGIKVNDNNLTGLEEAISGLGKNSSSQVIIPATNETSSISPSQKMLSKIKDEVMSNFNQSYNGDGMKPAMDFFKDDAQTVLKLAPFLGDSKDKAEQQVISQQVISQPATIPTQDFSYLNSGINNTAGTQIQNPSANNIALYDPLTFSPTMFPQPMQVL
jgi:hypothetical protein